MNQQLLRELIEFNKKEPLQVNSGLEVVPAKIYGGFRLTLMSWSEMIKSWSQMFGSPLPSSASQDKFWLDLESNVDGREYIAEFKREFSSRYATKDLLEGIQHLFMKPGFNQTGRPFVLEPPPTESPIDSTIYLWQNGEFAHAQSNMVILYSERSLVAPATYIGNVYYVKSKTNLKDLTDLLKAQNFREDEQ